VKPRSIIEKIEDDLEWRSHGGLEMPGVFLSREQAQELLKEIYKMRSQLEERSR
jgi:hypothetical protein